MKDLEKHQRLLNLIQAQDRKTVPVLPYDKARVALELLQNRIDSDLYQICAAANYLNAFVKQVESLPFKDAYYFKALLIDRLNDIEGSLESCCFLEKQTLLIESNGLQFSFHHVDLKGLKKAALFKEKLWCQMRLQPYALEIFLDALSVDDPN